MALDKINITETIANARKLLETDKQVSPALRAMFEMLLMIITLFATRLGLNSSNSSKPPSTDPNRKKKKKTNSNNKPGGQPGRVGKTLEPVTNPDTIIPIKLDKRHLPKGTYREVGFESRQVVDLEISCVVTEYRAQVLEDAQGKRYVAAFPKGVSRPIQYGQSIKAHAVYLSQFQLIPYERVADYFINEASIPISVGSLFNFNQEAYELLGEFDALAKQKLIQAALVHADETGINVNGKRLWLHNASNELWTYFYPHEKRGSEAMNEIGILPNFSGTLIHDHWKPYYTYETCTHGLCNAHHVRELQWVIDNHEHYTWAKAMQDLLLEINEAVNKTENNCLNDSAARAYRLRYSHIIQTGETEMPLPTVESNQSKKRGREKKTKERNLLERLRNFENDVLRFMLTSEVPFTNNRGENDIRMTKVQQKISGCFKSLDGAKIFCRVRSYLLTAQKHNVTPSEALKSLFAGKLPEILLAE
ncbi:MAG: IS66 family transposase [Rickettsiales bacterium]